ncbi:MAG: PEGA domain-containing protein [Phycisphaerales bacterium]
MRVALRLMFVGSVLLGSVLGSSMGGCATIRNEKFKEVEFTSDPSGATVVVEEEVVGTTPVVVEVARKGRDKLVEIALEGYKSVRLNLDRSVEGKTIFGGLIGMSVDAISGKAGTYTDSVHIVLEEGEGVVEVDSKDLDALKEEENLEEGEGR